MASDKEYLRGLLRDDADSLPPHLAWDQMREGILSSMNGQGDPDPDPERPAKRRMAWWWLPLLLLVAGLPIAIYAYLGGQAQQPTATVASPTAAVVPAAPPAHTEEACPPVAIQAREGALSGPVAAPRTGSEGTASSQPSAKPALPMADASAATPLSGTPTLVPPMSAALPPAAAAQTGALPAAPESELAPVPSMVLPAVDGLAAALEAAMPLPTLATPALEVPTGSPATPAPAHRRPARSWYLGLTVGTVQEVGRPALQANAPQGVTVSETALYGSSALVYAEASLYRHTYARLGLAQQQLLSRLDYKAVQRTEVLTSNIVVQRQVNAITGDTTLVQADTLLGATRTRIVQHYNQSRLFNIPLSIGYRYPIGRWDLGLEATASFNIRARHTGLQYRAADDSLAPVSDPEGSLLKTNVGAALGLGVSVAYRISPRASLAYQGSLSQYLEGWAQPPGANRQPRLVSHGLGLRWRL